MLPVKQAHNFHAEPKARHMVKSLTLNLFKVQYKLNQREAEEIGAKERNKTKTKNNTGL